MESFLDRQDHRFKRWLPGGREEESERDCLGAVCSITVQMSSAVGRAAGSSCRQALMACSISGGHSSGTLHPPTQLPFRVH